MHALADLRVLDLSSGIAGPYCTKLLADAGADVVKVESPAGDPMRHWSPTGADLEGRDGAGFTFLNTSKRSVIGTLADAEVAALLTGTDLLVEDGTLSDAEIDALRTRHPHLVVLSITPFGRTGPLAGRPQCAQLRARLYSGPGLPPTSWRISHPHQADGRPSAERRGELY